MAASTTYDHAALHLADLFRSNFDKYADLASPQILAGAPLA
jgi:phosphoenolpyruvate carboxykinase (ATP)